MGTNAKRRRNKLTPTVRRAIVESVSLGTPWEIAARAAGISASSITSWRRRGEELQQYFEDTGEFPDEMSTLDWACLKLADEVEVAHAKTVSSLTNLIVDAAPKNWAAAAWWLERREPELFEKGARKRASLIEDEAASRGGLGGVTIVIPDNGRGPNREQH